METVDVTSCAKKTWQMRFIQDLKMGRLSWIFLMGSKCLHNGVYTTDAEGHVTTEKEKTILLKRQGLQWCNHKPRNVSSQQKLEEETTDSCLEQEEGAPPTSWFLCTVKLISGIWPGELWEDKYLLFEAAKYVVLCYTDHRKQIQRSNTRNLHLFLRKW